MQESADRGQEAIAEDHYQGLPAGGGTRYKIRVVRPLTACLGGPLPGLDWLGVFERDDGACFCFDGDGFPGAGWDGDVGASAGAGAFPDGCLGVGGFDGFVDEHPGFVVG
jgi:hypothetical protein